MNSALGNPITDPVLLSDNVLTGSLLTELLTVREVAKLLKISISGVRRLQQRRLIPFIKVGGSLRFATNDVLSFLAKQRVEPIG